MARKPTDLTLGTARPAVIDIGSNSVRLVIFDKRSRSPIAVFNEKSLPALGRGLEKNLHLNPEGVPLALAAIDRFCFLAKSLGVSDLALLATAAIRDAKDGPAFAKEVEKRTGKKVEIISGQDEARYSAQGVIAGIPQAHGLMGDLGGGSLELVALHEGKIGKYVTLPLGPLRLIDRTEGNLDNARSLIDTELAKLDWLSEMEGQFFYPVGGTWRSLAKIHMAYAQYPLHIIQEYRLSRKSVESIADILGHLGKKTLSAISGINKKRIDALPYGALVMERLLKILKPKEVVFSAYGLREGYLFDQLNEQEKKDDPLLAGCRDMASAQGRFGSFSGVLFLWLDPLFEHQPLLPARIREAACILSDLSWREHPDYRAEHAFFRTLRAPVGGISHPDRSILAVALAVRYGASLDEEFMRGALSLMDESQRAQSLCLGKALRLAYALSAGAPEMLTHTQLLMREHQIVLQLPKARQALLGETVVKRLNSLAQAMEVQAELEYR